MGNSAEIEARPAPLTFDPLKSTLIVVDMQNDFLDPQGWFPASGVDPAPLWTVVEPIRALAQAFRRAAAPVVWVNWGVSPGAPEVPPNLKRKAALGGRRPTYGEPSASGRGRVLVRGDWGAQCVEALTPSEGDLVVHKRRLSGFHETELDSVLRNRGVETVFFAGVNIDRCVFATLTDAAARGYACVLIEDACATVSPRYVTDAILYLVPLLHGSVAYAAAVGAALESFNVSQPEVDR